MNKCKSAMGLELSMCYFSFAMHLCYFFFFHCSCHIIPLLCLPAKFDLNGVMKQPKLNLLNNVATVHLVFTVLNTFMASLGLEFGW
uniref:Uncharacterized protein n=1 Tax=Scleropages formosus TaxID=113540 RepID=A0A8C9RQE8_SCLFO